MFNHSSHVVILVSFLAGWLARKRRVVPENAHLSLNGFVIHLALPALILFQVPKFLKTQTLTPALVSLGLMPWVGFLLAWFILRLVSDRLGFSREARIAITVAVGLGNTAFVGFPILEALLGPDALPYGIILDQLGTFLVLTAVGVSYLAYHQEEARQDEAQLSDKTRIASVSLGSVLNRILNMNCSNLPAKSAIRLASTKLPKNVICNLLILPKPYGGLISVISIPV